MLVLDISQQTTIDCKRNLISNVVQALTVNVKYTPGKMVTTEFRKMELMKGHWKRISCC